MKFILITVFLVSHFLFASVWQLKSPSFTSYRKGSYYNTLNLKYRGTRVIVNYKNKLPRSAQDLIREMVTQFYANKAVAFRKITFYYQNDVLSFLIEPTSIRGKEDLLKLLPSGMKFYYDDVLLYDFGMIYQGNFIRLKGLFKSMKDLVGEIDKATSSFSLGNIDQYDPNYLINQLRFLDKEIKEIKRRLGWLKRKKKKRT